MKRGSNTSPRNFNALSSNACKPIETRFKPALRNSRKFLISTDVGLASKVISVSFSKDQSLDALFIMSAAIEGFINDGVPPPKKILFIWKA